MFQLDRTEPNQIKINQTPPYHTTPHQLFLYSQSKREGERERKNG